MSVLVLIPARLAATRLPRKPLADIAGKAMIAHVADRAAESGVGRVAVATDSSPSRACFGDCRRTLNVSSDSFSRSLRSGT